MFSNNVHRITKEKIMQIYEFRETTNMEKYLGVPLSGKSLKRRDYQYLTEQLKSKLATSKTNQLSFACRVTLAKSILVTLSIYPMMTNILPKACIDEIHIIYKIFIWGDTNKKRKHHAINWDMVTKHKDA